MVQIMNFPHVAEIINAYNFSAVFTSVDMQKEEGTVKFFPNVKAARDWVHERSLEQFPQWHKENCPDCKQVPLPLVAPLDKEL